MTTKLPIEARKALAIELGRDEQTLRRWERAGIDLSDCEAVEAHIASLQRDVENGASSDTEGLKEWKARKTKANALKEEFAAEKARLEVEERSGNLISVPEMAELSFAIASQVGAMLSRLEGELPGQLEGLSAADMQPVIREKTDTVRRFLADQFSSVAVETGPGLHDIADRENT